MNIQEFLTIAPYLTLSIVASAVMDSVMSNNTFARWGLWYSKDGWKCKYILTEWFARFLPLDLSKFLAQDVLVGFTDLWHFAKTIMVLSFCMAINQEMGVFMWLIWGFVFSPVYAIIRSL